VRLTPTFNHLPAAVRAAETPGQDAQAARHTCRGGSALAAGLLSFVWPGLGQFYLRRRNEAILFALPALAAALWLIAQLSQGGAFFVGSFFADAGFALTFALITVFIGIWRGVSMVHAYVLAARQRPRLLDVGVMVALLLAILASHTWVVRTAWAAYVFDNSVGQNDFLSDLPTISPDPSEEYVASPTPTPIPQSWAPVATIAPPQPSSAITPRPTTQRITILLTGIDHLETNSHSLMDSLLVVSLDPRTRKVTMVSVPRDTSNYEFYWGGNAGVNTKINNFYNLVRAKLVDAPDDPLTALKKEIGWLVGVRIDYYAIIDLHGFRVLVDMVGGVCVNNPRAINDPFTGTFVEKGDVCMDGITTLKYVRSRHGAGDNDYTRAGRQQDVMYALSQKLVTPEGLLLLPDLLALAGTSVQTDFPLKTVNKYISIAQNLKSSNVSQCVLGPPYNYHPPSTQTKGTWTSRLKPAEVAKLSVYLFGVDSRFYGLEGIVPTACQRRD
jgi:LCP family protein required for cell wall assembly